MTAEQTEAMILAHAKALLELMNLYEIPTVHKPLTISISNELILASMGDDIKVKEFLNDISD